MATSRLDVLDRYMEGFRRSDHELVLGCLTEDVVWRVHGVRTANGKAEFDSEIENPDFEGSPELMVDRTVEAGDVIVITGTGAGHHREAGRFEFVYSDLFTFRGDLIAKVESDVVPVAECSPLPLGAATIARRVIPATGWVSGTGCGSVARGSRGPASRRARS